MKKTLLALALFATATSASAAWTLGNNTDDMTDKVTSYHISTRNIAGNDHGYLSLTCQTNGDFLRVQQSKFMGVQGANDMLVRVDDNVMFRADVIWTDSGINKTHAAAYLGDQAVPQFKDGMSVRVKLKGEYKDLNALTYSLDGFGKAYTEFRQKCDTIQK
ncbi:hypothetical protein [Vibrio sp. WXL210]|uniref:hypothetical protein n=1 Tax=Vibrio sp. WXL210 TaxID=3450709 RepID=UPI003EC82120